MRPDFVRFIDYWVNGIHLILLVHSFSYFIYQYVVRYQLIRQYNIRRPFVPVVDVSITSNLVAWTFLWNAYKPALVENSHDTSICIDEKWCGIDQNWGRLQKHPIIVFWSFAEYYRSWRLNLIFMTILYDLQNILHICRIIADVSIFDFFFVLFGGSIFYSGTVLATSVNLGDFSIRSDQLLLVTISYWLLFVMITWKLFEPFSGPSASSDGMLLSVQPEPLWRQKLHQKYLELLDDELGFEIGMNIRQFLDANLQPLDDVIILQNHRKLAQQLRERIGNDLGMLLYSFLFDDAKKLPKF